MQHQITRPSNLFNKNGVLLQKGWAKKPLLIYNRENIRVDWHRIKEWDHYAILNPEYGFLLTLSDIGYLSLIGVQWLDFKKRKGVVGGNIRLFTKGNLNLPRSSEKGDIYFRGGGILALVKRLKEKRIIYIDYPRFMIGKGIKGKLVLHQDPEMDTTVVATPFKENPYLFYYNHKVNYMPTEGTVKIGNKVYEFNKESSIGNLDWGRGVWPYKTHWLWGSAAGKVNGVPFGINIGYGFGDLSTHTENIFFYKGKAHKLDKVTFKFDRNYPGKPWQFTSNDGRFNMVMKPIIPRKNKLDLLIIMTNTSLAFGYYSGYVILDNGEKIHVENILGWAEDIYWKW